MKFAILWLDDLHVTYYPTKDDLRNALVDTSIVCIALGYNEAAKVWAEYHTVVI